MMPQGTRYRSEIAMDMNLARVIFDMHSAAEEEQRMKDLLKDDDESPEDEELVPTSSVGHTVEVELMMKMVDLIQVLNSTLIGVNLPKGKKPPKVRPHPRPVSAFQVLEKESEKKAVSSALEDMGLFEA